MAVSLLFQEEDVGMGLLMFVNVALLLAQTLSCELKSDIKLATFTGDLAILVSTQPLLLVAINVS